MKRRTFLASAAATGAMACLSPSTTFAAEDRKLKQGEVILFQGDSITDAGRNKKDPVANQGLGRGYPNHIAESLHKDYPDLNLQIHNRGISGHKVPDLAKRWQRDCIDIKPDILSILIGVNDIWHMLNGRYDGTVDTYREGYTALVEQTQQALPNLTLVICEPFVLMSGTVKANKDKWFPEFDQRRAAAKEVFANAKGGTTLWVPFQTMFDDAVQSGVKPEELAGDGVHPTQKGHALMAKTWREVVGI